jgi:ureidoglycolate lyase
MREIKYSKLIREGFAKYGTFAAMINPAWPKIGVQPIEFYRDMVQTHLGGSASASFGVCRVAKRPFVMDVSEYHNECCEIVLPLDGDVLLHVAPAVPEREFPFEEAEVFLVPKGTMCCLRPGVWHHAPYALETEVVNCLILLPERTYVNDCTVYQFPPERHVKIVGQGI